MPEKQKSIQLKSTKDFESLFHPTTPEKLNREENNSEKIIDINIENLLHYPKHPFKLYSGDKLDELAISIRENGLINPVLITPVKDEYGKYYILSGHNRVSACKFIGLSSIKSIVIENITSESADLIVVESNLIQREKLLPSEKAKAYKMQLEALKSQGKRMDLINIKNDDTLSPVGTKLSSSKKIALKNNDSRTNVYRYICLNNLIEEILKLVDEETIPLRAAVELSYIKCESQKKIHQYFYIENDYKINLEISKKLRNIDENSEILSSEDIEQILNKPSKAINISLRIPVNKFKYLLEDIPVKMQTEYIIKAIEFYKKSINK